MRNTHFAFDPAAWDSRYAAEIRTFPGGGKRRAPRLAISLRGVISWRDDKAERTESVVTTSIGQFGCAIRSSTFLQPGTRLRLDFGRGAIEGHVVHSLKDYSAKLVTVGVAFEREACGFWPVGLDFGG